MSTNDMKFTPPAQKQAQPQATAPTQEAPQMNTPSFGMGADRFDTSSFFQTPLMRSSASEQLTKGMDKIKAAIAPIIANAPNALVDVIALDTDNNINLPCPALVITFTNKIQPSLGTSYYALLLTGQAPTPDATVINVGGEPVEVMPLPSDAYDPQTKEELRRAVQKRFQNATLIDAEGTTLPKDFNFDDDTRVTAVTLNALIACRDLVDSRVANWQDLNLRHLPADMSKNLRADVQVSRRTEQILDAVGNPVRSDLKVELVTSIARGANQPNVSRKLASVAGYVDLLYAPQAPQQAQVWGAPPVRGATYQPRIVVTHMQSDVLNSIGGQLLTFISAFALYQNNVALSSLYPVQGEGVDLHDIGVLNIEANLTGGPVVPGQPVQRGERLDVRQASFQEKAAYLQALLAPAPDLAIDVSACGPDTWMNSVFVAAAYGHPEAIEAIRQAANQLTDGEFGKIFTASNMMRVETRIPVGYYTDKNGHKRDTRDVDYLAVANSFIETEPQRLEEWSNAVVRTDIHEAKRMQTFRRTNEAVIQSPVTYTGYAYRVIVNPEFMKALQQAAITAGLSLSVRGANTAQEEHQRFAYSQQYQMTPGVIGQGLFNQPTSFQAGGGVFQPQNVGRW